MKMSQRVLRNGNAVAA